MSTLFVPLSLAALGIVLRGAGFAFRQGRRGGSPAQRLFGAIFAHLLGADAVLHGHGRRRDRVGPGAGRRRRRPARRAGCNLHLVLDRRCCSWPRAPTWPPSSWSPTPASAATRSWPRTSRAAALVAAAVAGALAARRPVRAARRRARRCSTGSPDEGLPLVIALGACGAGALVAARARGAPRGARPLAAAAPSPR